MHTDQVLQIREHFIRGLITMLDSFSRCASGYLFKLRRHAERSKRWQRAALMEVAHFGPVQHRVAGRGFKRRFAGKHFVKNDTDRVDVYSRIVTGGSGDSL